MQDPQTLEQRIIDEWHYQDEIRHKTVKGGLDLYGVHLTALVSMNVLAKVLGYEPVSRYD